MCRAYEMNKRTTEEYLCPGKLQRGDSDLHTVIFKGDPENNRPAKILFTKEELLKYCAINCKEAKSCKKKTGEKILENFEENPE
ncbi:MAG: hypothetical protein WC875_01705 [Candidatus Absconditabacterales bacterium]